MKESKVLEVLGLTSSDIQDMLIQGMTFPEIAKMYGVEYISLLQAYKIQRNLHIYCFKTKKMQDEKHAKTLNYQLTRV